EIGMGTPRESLRLQRDDQGATHLVVPKTGEDHTERMRAWSLQKIAALRVMGLSGYVLKAKSPSCGMERVKVYDGNGIPNKDGQGVFAEALIAAFPQLPIEEEGRLNDPRLRESFFERVFAYTRLRRLFSSEWSPADLVAFHTREKLLLRAHDELGYQDLGRLVANLKAPREQVATRYQEMFMSTLAKKMSRGRNVNVLHHMLGYLKRELSADCKAEVLRHVEDYSAGHVPLLVPLTLLRHYVRLHDVRYLATQSYLDPHPKELMLRTFIL
ncbi:MAG: DUF1722 domain-containing protein, partial [Planctomycetes bacterium]|nr:DUF1722 domain-containing protein [Planctomycetota bacterium]